MGEVAPSEGSPNDPFLFDECVVKLSSFAMEKGRPKVTNREGDQWRYTEPDPGEPSDAMMRVCEVDDKQTGEPRMMNLIVHTNDGVFKTNSLAELVWSDEYLPPEDEEDTAHLTEHTINLHPNYEAIYERFTLDPTGARHSVERFQLNDEQLTDFHDELETLRTV